jgi:hypothetical protein
LNFLIIVTLDRILNHGFNSSSNNNNNDGGRRVE